MKKNKSMIIALVVIAIVIVTGIVFICLRNKKTVIDFDGFAQLTTYKAGSDYRSGLDRGDGFFSVEQICNGLDIDRDTFNLHNPKLETLDYVVKGLEINYPKA